MQIRWNVAERRLFLSFLAAPEAGCSKFQGSLQGISLITDVPGFTQGMETTVSRAVSDAGHAEPRKHVPVGRVEITTFEGFFPLTVL